MNSGGVPHIKLPDGTQIPAIGFGSALHNGYRYIDTAQQYGNAEYVGEALKKWGGKREDLYIVTKYGVDGEDSEPREVLMDQLKKLGVDHVDLYLVHNPFYAAPRTPVENWKIMEQLKDEGLTKSIGVSNFREEDIQDIKKGWKYPPAVNQIELNPYVYHPANVQRLLALCKSEHITIECYGPLNSLFRSTDGPIDGIVNSIAERKGCTPSQVLLLWAHQYSGGGPVVTTSRNDARQREQLEAMTKVTPLTDSEVDEIAEAGKGRFYRHFQHKVWDKAAP